MTDYIIVGILLVVLAIGVRSTIKHFKHESSCCGGGTYRAKRKKLRKVVEKKTFRVEGMTCTHCQNRVEEAVNAIEGAAGRVNLNKGIVVVSLEKKISDATIKEAIEKAGYDVK